MSVFRSHASHASHASDAPFHADTVVLFHAPRSTLRLTLTSFRFKNLLVSIQLYSGSIKDRVLHCSAVGVPSLHLLRCHGSQSACAASAFGNGIAEHCAFLGSARYLSHGSWCSSCLLRYVSRFKVDLLQLSSPPPPPPPHLSPPLPHPRTQPYN